MFTFISHVYKHAEISVYLIIGVHQNNMHYVHEIKLGIHHFDVFLQIANQLYNSCCA